MKKISTLTALAAAVSLALCANVSADSFTDAVTSGKVNADFRVRYETVDQNNPLKNADALTLRARLGYTTAELNGFFGMLEFEGNKAIIDDYNSTINGNANYSTVVDPEFEEVNQAFVGYKVGNNLFKYGRQRLALDNHRFVGTVGWRQNEQTFDGFSFNNKGDNHNITVAYLTNANRIFSDQSPQGDFRMESPIVNANFKFGSVGSLSAYGYFLDFNDAVTQSSQTLGLRFNGKTNIADKKSLTYTVEYAQQEDYGDNPIGYSEDYLNLELGVDLTVFNAKLAYEVLGGNGVAAFKTPLATLHAFNGWTDQFLNTPVNGLQDLNVSVGTTVAGAKASVVYHEFSADSGSADYGTEFGFVLSKGFGKNYSVGLKYAQYDADTQSVDTDKLWVWAEMKF